MVRPPVGVSAPPGAALSERQQPSRTVGRFPTVLLFSPEDFPDARAMQADRLAYLGKRRSGFLRLGESFAPCLSRGFHVPLVIELRAPRLGERFSFGVPRHGSSLSLAPVVSIGRGIGPLYLWRAKG